MFYKTEKQNYVAKYISCESDNILNNSLQDTIHLRNYQNAINTKSTSTVIIQVHSTEQNSFGQRENTTDGALRQSII